MLVDGCIRYRMILDIDIAPDGTRRYQYLAHEAHSLRTRSLGANSPRVPSTPSNLSCCMYTDIETIIIITFVKPFEAA
jgi:hypothetical protein